MALSDGFSRPIYQKRVKSRGSCQAVSSQPSVISNRPSVLIDRPTCNAGTEMGVTGAGRPFRGSSGTTESLRGQLVDSKKVASRVPQPQEVRHVEFKGLTGDVSGQRRSDLFGFCRRLKSGEAKLMIQQGLLNKLLRRTGEDLLNLKDLLTVFPRSCRATFSGFVGPLPGGEANMLIQQWLLETLLKRTGERSLNLKDLLTVLPRSGRATFSGFVGPLPRGEAYLLIPKGLLARLRRRTGGCMLNLKDLLIGFASSLRRSLENLPVLRPRFCAKSPQILPFSGENVQMRAENARLLPPILGKHRRCEIIAKGLPTQRHRGTEKNDKPMEINDISCIFPLLLCVSAPLCLILSQLHIGSRGFASGFASGRERRTLCPVTALNGPMQCGRTGSFPLEDDLSG